MKMNRQNPGGKLEAAPTMKGCEQHQQFNKPGLNTGDIMTKGSRSSKNGLNGWVPAGKARGGCAGY